MKSFALFRLPFDEHYVELQQNSGKPLRLFHISDLNGMNGFVVIPFHVTTETPIVLIKPDVVKTHCDYKDKETCGITDFDWHDNRESYHIDFERFHQELDAGRMSKLVLSRTATVDSDRLSARATDLFIRACQRYPRMFVALVSLPDGDMWLTATPEGLLQGSHDHYNTMALAGTMRLHEEELSGEGEHIRWAAKEIEEQRYVASYIADQLKSLTVDYDEHGPRTVRAANLVHLRSDFSFNLPTNVSVCELLQTLHPTPAVCGLPKQNAYQFILSHESAPRLYYSGFMGPINFQQETHLYVTLRCMQISQQGHHTLYAGGGLLRESIEEQEWLETEAKLETMRSLLSDQ